MTLRVLSRPGRISNTGHIFTIVRNVCGEQALSELGKIQMVTDTDSDQMVGLRTLSCMTGSRMRSAVTACQRSHDASELTFI